MDQRLSQGVALVVGVALDPVDGVLEVGALEQDRLELETVGVEIVDDDGGGCVPGRGSHQVRGLVGAADRSQGT